MYNVVTIGDHQMVCAAIRSLLERQGQFSVVSECNSGISGLSAARELRPDLLIVDLDIPQLVGIQVIRWLRAERIPMNILVVSGAEEATSALQAQHSGANGFVNKAAEVSELINAALRVASGKSILVITFCVVPRRRLRSRTDRGRATAPASSRVENIE